MSPGKVRGADGPLRELLLPLGWRGEMLMAPVGDRRLGVIVRALEDGTRIQSALDAVGVL